MLSELACQDVANEVRPMDAGSRTTVEVTRPDPWPYPIPTTLRPRLGEWYLAGRYALESAVALVLSLVALPFLALAALAVKLTSQGPAFYTQTRVGRNGRLFTIYKLRTMMHNCESLTGPRWSLPGDPRVTLVGRFLRTTHLDELPQLLNVLRGEMSLIGPRPERPEFVPKLELELANYRERLAVRPGVTGLAQVQLAADTDLESVRRKLAHDLYYVERLGPWLDLRILVATAFYTLGAPLALIRRLRVVPGGLRVECATPTTAEVTRPEARLVA